MQSLPNHLQKYVVKQNYEKYTPLDQAVWRYVLRQLKNFLTKHAHESYLDGLEKTGIDVEQIPRIENVSAHLEKFGWRAVPVSGFIPPAAFMELQSLNVLPIASDMRSIDHLLYTPAPDIVHEAAGHAPIIANTEYSDYLKQYAQIAKKAILSKQDLEQYQAIRELSDIKENPSSTALEISAAEEKLKHVMNETAFISEAAELSRMNWWTAEYGLVGQVDSAKIFGAGLLSSIGESKWCLSDKVKKIPLTLDCVKQSYDITEPQPQLFVAQNFKDLSRVLDELAETMAFRKGGSIALDKAVQAATVNTVQFENGLQISGVLKSYRRAADESIAYVQFEGPTQLCLSDKEIAGHDSKYHQHGYGTPVGTIQNLNFAALEVQADNELTYESGISVRGRLDQIKKLSDKAVILTFSQATCEWNGEKLFLPEWGLYDILLVNQVTSVFGGPADRAAYGDFDDFIAARVQETRYTDEQKKRFTDYQKVRSFREYKAATADEFKELFLKISQEMPNEWLLYVELLEIGYQRNYDVGFLKLVEFHLSTLQKKNDEIKSLIEEGIRLAHAKY